MGLAKITRWEEQNNNKKKMLVDRNIGNAQQRYIWTWELILKAQFNLFYVKGQTQHISEYIYVMERWEKKKKEEYRKHDFIL